MIMKAADLRLGNFILNRKDEIEQVKLLSVEHVINGNAGIIPDNEMLFKGIVLTKEWIIKLGLDRMEETEYTVDTYDLAGFKLWVKRHDILFNDKIKIYYVHELQNLYHSLTNKELTL